MNAGIATRAGIAARNRLHGLRGVLAITSLLVLAAALLPATADASDAWEPDDSRVSVAGIACDNALVWRALDVDGDVDWMALAVSAGDTYVIEAVPSATDPWFDVRIDVFASTSPVAFATDDDGGTNLMPRLVVTAATSGTWHIRVTGFSYWTTGSYALRVRKVVPATVLGSVTGVADMPLPGATVTAYAPDTTGWNITAKTTAASNGSYTLTLEPGAYRLSYSAAGGAYPTRYWNEASALEDADSVELQPGQDLNTGSFCAVEWSRIHGVVTAWDGATPLGNVSVAAYRYANGRWQAFSWTVTEASGAWSMPLAHGTYRFGYTDNSGTSLSSFHPNANNLDAAEEVRVDGPSVALEASLAAPSRVQGTVSDSLSGDPLGNVSVSLVTRSDAGWVSQAQATTLADGSFSIDYHTGTYALWFCAQDGAYCPAYHDGCTCGEHVTELDVRAEGLVVDVGLEPAATISGRITDPGSGDTVDAARIQALRYDGEAGTWSAVAETRSDTAGTYELKSLRAGTYRVTAALKDSPQTARFFGGQTLESATDVVIASGQIFGSVDIAISSDTQPPVTSADTNRLLLAPATVQLLATDDSAVARTLHRLDGAEWVEGDRVVIGTRGEHTLEYYSVDIAGNAEKPTLESVVVREATVSIRTLAGADRCDTAAQVSRESFPGGAETLIVVTGSSWPDGLGAASLAGALDAPILLVKTDSVPAAVATEARRLLPAQVIVIGGPSAVSAQVAAHFEGLVGSTHVVRIGGADRYETAQLVAQATLEAMESAGRPWDGTYVLASGLSFPDVLAASPLSAALGWPVLLTKPTELSAATAAFIDEHPECRALVVGGPAAVSTAVQTQAANRSGSTGIRLSGKDRYETALSIAAYAADGGLLGYTHMAIATGQDFPDALTCSVRQAKAGSVLLLTPRSSLDADVAAMLESLPLDQCCDVTFVGGAAAISQAVREQVVAHLAR